MSQLKRSVNIDIFVEQVKHGYLAHPYILNYILSHINKSDKLKNIINELQKEFTYINWTSDNDDDQIKRLTEMIPLLVNFLQD
jgi:hypothetical protein